MTAFALIIEPPLRNALMAGVEAAFITFVLVAFLSVAIYALREWRLGRLVGGRNAPLPIAMPSLRGWTLVAAVLALIYLQSPLYAFVVIAGTIGVLIENQRSIRDQYGLDRIPLLR